MARWTSSQEESKHITDILIKSVTNFGKEVTYYMQNGAVYKGILFKNGSQLSDDLKCHHGYVVIRQADGNLIELDALDVKAVGVGI